MEIINLSIAEFNNLVKYLKRLDDIGDDFFLKNDIICPSVRTEKNRPGKHIVRSMIPTSDKYEDVLYGVARLSETSKLLGDIKGKKQSLFIEQSEDGIWINANDLRCQLAGVYNDEDETLVESLAPAMKNFDDYLRHEWMEIPLEHLIAIKNGDVITYEDDRKSTYVRVARDLFPLRGVTRRTAPVDHTAELYISSPETTDGKTLVIGSSDKGVLEIHVTYPVIEVIHFYMFMPFH